MRRAWVFLPLLLAGCKPGRQVAVSNTGRFASTVDGGTFVVGTGRVAEGGEALAFSPDGKSLAIAGKGGVTLWPSGRRIAKIGPPIAWSPDGGSLAGAIGANVVVADPTTGRTKPTEIEGIPERLRWTAEGKLVGIDPKTIQVDGGPTASMKAASILDAVPTSGGKIAYLAWAAPPDSAGDVLRQSIVRGEWDTQTGALTRVDAGKVVDLFGTATPGRLDVPFRFALAANGTSFVVAAMRVEAPPASLDRMITLADKDNLTHEEQREMNARLKSARLTSVIVRVDGAGRAETVWTAPSDRESAVTDLECSPDGHWLVVAQPNGTIEFAIEP